jgi:hypothetical protein
MVELAELVESYNCMLGLGAVFDSLIWCDWELHLTHIAVWCDWEL